MTFYILLSNTLVIHSCACDLQGLRGEMSFSLSFVTIGVDVPLAIVATIAFASSSSLSLSSFPSSISLFLLCISYFDSSIFSVSAFTSSISPAFLSVSFFTSSTYFPRFSQRFCLVPFHPFLRIRFLLVSLWYIFVIHHFSGKCEISDVTLWGGLCGSV